MHLTAKNFYLVRIGFAGLLTKYQGCLGLNNIKATDYVNVVIQSLCRVKDLKDYLVLINDSRLESEEVTSDFLVIKRFSDLLKKIWNPKNFKGHVSPHELMQAISLRSKKSFKIEEQSDPHNFLAWFITELNKEFVKFAKRDDSKHHYINTV